jgi:hypothetical protein
MKTSHLDFEVRVRCNLCRTVAVVKVHKDDYIDWHEGRHAQDAFPYLSAADRELLISSTCGTCWDEIMGDDDE